MVDFLPPPGQAARGGKCVWGGGIFVLPTGRVLNLKEGIPRIGVSILGKEEGGGLRLEKLVGGGGGGIS